jgi:hypothetical protein
MKLKSFSVVFGVAFVVLICGVVVLWQRVQSLDGQVNQLRHTINTRPHIEQLVVEPRQSEPEQKPILMALDFPETSVADGRWDVDRAMIIDSYQRRSAMTR